MTAVVFVSRSPSKCTRSDDFSRLCQIVNGGGASSLADQSRPSSHKERRWDKRQKSRGPRCIAAGGPLSQRTLKHTSRSHIARQSAAIPAPAASTPELPRRTAAPEARHHKMRHRPHRLPHQFHGRQLHLIDCPGSIAIPRTTAHRDPGGRCRPSWSASGREKAAAAADQSCAELRTSALCRLPVSHQVDTRLQAPTPAGRLARPLRRRRGFRWCCGRFPIWNGDLIGASRDSRWSAPFVYPRAQGLRSGGAWRAATRPREGSPLLSMLEKLADHDDGADGAAAEIVPPRDAVFDDLSREPARTDLSGVRVLRSRREAACCG